MARGVDQEDGKMNLAVGDKNPLDNSGGKKRLVIPFRRHEFCTCIGCILLEVTYGNKGHKLWGETQISIGKKVRAELHRYVRGKTDVMNVCCGMYRMN